MVQAFGEPPADHPDRPIADGAEPWNAYRSRACATLEAILERHSGTRILIVGHAETVTAAHHHVLAASMSLPTAFTVHQASLTVWTLQPVSWIFPDAGHRWALTFHNDTSHLTQPADSSPRAAELPRGAPLKRRQCSGGWTPG